MDNSGQNNRHRTMSKDVKTFVQQRLSLIRCPLGQVRSGQVRSESLTCTFRTSCCNARLSRVQVPAFAGSSVRNRGKKARELGGTAYTGGYKGVRAV